MFGISSWSDIAANTSFKRFYFRLEIPARFGLLIEAIRDVRAASLDDPTKWRVRIERLVRGLPLARSISSMLPSLRLYFLIA